MRESGITLLSAREALRSRSAIVVALLVTGGAAALWWGAVGDGSPAGRLRAFLSWGTGLIWLLLSLVAVFLSTSIGRAAQDGRLVALCLSPVDRVRVLLAWWVGVAGVLLGLTALSAGTILLLARASLFLADERARPAVGAVLQARGVARPPRIDHGELRAKVEEELLARVKREGLPQGMTFAQALQVELERAREARLTVRPGREISWALEGIEPEEGATSLTVRFYYLVEDEQTQLAAGRGPHGVLGLVPPGSAGYGVNGAWEGAGGTRIKRHEVPFPVEYLEGKSDLLITYQNVEERPIVVRFTENSAPCVLYPAGGFEANVARMAVLIWGRLLFLSAMGVALSALLDPKLAALVSLFALAVGSAHGFLVEAIHPAYDAWGPTLGPPMRAFLQTVMLALPDLGRDDVAQLLAEGERVDWRAALSALLGDGVARGGSVLVAGAFLFSRRELGAVRGL